MKAKKVFEIAFKRGEDPKQSLGLGPYRNNPFPLLEDKVKQVLKNPMDHNFMDFKNNLKSFTVQFNRMLIINESGSQFPEIKIDTGTDETPDGFLDPEIVFRGVYKGRKLTIVSSAAQQSYYVAMEKSPGKDDHNFSGYIKTMSGLLEAMQKLINKT